MLLMNKTRILREYLQISQREFAKIIGSNQTEVSFIERGFIPENSGKIKIIESLYEFRIGKGETKFKEVQR